MLEEKTRKLLEKAGWYEGRKIDITKEVKKLEEAGYEVFDSAKRFLREFGRLDIVARYLDEGEEYYDEHSTKYEDLEYCFKDNFNYDEEVGEKTIPVCKLYRGEYIVCISESGKFFISEGMRALDVEDLWNGLLGKYKGGFLSWVDYKAGKEYKIMNYKNEEYY